MPGNETTALRRGIRARPNAICVGGPCHGMLTRIHQDVGVVHVPVRPPCEAPDGAYRITSRRVHHPSSDVPFTVLTWADAAGVEESA